MRIVSSGLVTIATAHDAPGQTARCRGNLMGGLAGSFLLFGRTAEGSWHMTTPHRSLLRAGCMVAGGRHGRHRTARDDTSPVTPGLATQDRAAPDPRLRQPPDPELLRRQTARTGTPALSGMPGDTRGVPGLRRGCAAGAVPGVQRYASMKSCCLWATTFLSAFLTPVDCIPVRISLTMFFTLSIATAFGTTETGCTSAPACR